MPCPEARADQQLCQVWKDSVLSGTYLGQEEGGGGIGKGGGGIGKEVVNFPPVDITDPCCLNFLDPAQCCHP